jgi:hypothetical protein
MTFRLDDLDTTRWRETGMPKKLLKWGGLAFLVFFVAYRPQNAANLFTTLGNGLMHMADGVGQFFSSIVS